MPLNLRMRKILTDFDLLSEIHRRYYDKFRSFEGSVDRISKIYVPIDIVDLAKYFEKDPDVIFGRLYYHLERKFGYVRDDKTKVAFFTPAVGSDKNAVNFPLLAAVLADLQEKRSKDNWSFRFSVFAIIVSSSSLLLTGLKLWHDNRSAPLPNAPAQVAPAAPMPPSEQ